MTINSPLLLVLVCGCGGETFHNISGIVTLDGAPLDGASITFVPVEKGNPAVGRTDAGGRYTLETGNTAGIRPGSYKVVVVKNAYTPYDERTGQGGALLPSPVPVKYAKAETSDITLTVPGERAYDVKLAK
ncbi:carboxypeptidase-like regulatory domain-containing protein [soil metagenome]